MQESHLSDGQRIDQWQVDISSKGQFPGFNQFWGGYIKELKDEGRNDTLHHPEIPPASLIGILEFLGFLEELMECDKEKEKQKYQSLVAKLPEVYKNGYHKLIQYGAMFIICLFTARRGREGNLNKYFNFHVCLSFCPIDCRCKKFWNHQMKSTYI